MKASTHKTAETIELRSFRELKRELLRDPKVQRAHKESELGHKLICALIEKRIREKLTQKDLAERIGTKQSAISRFERGDSNPTLAFAQKLARELGVKITVSAR